MRRTIRTVLGLLSLVAGLAAPLSGQAQGFSANYSLHMPELRVAAPASGLSLEAGHKWFARVGVGASIVDQERVSVGGGYRFPDGQSLSVQLVRGLGQDRLGLAVRYDWASNYYLRLSYDRRWGDALTNSQPDMLRFSAGIRF